MTTLKQFKEEHFYIEKTFIYLLMIVIVIGSIVATVIGSIVATTIMVGYETGYNDSQTKQLNYSKIDRPDSREFTYMQITIDPNYHNNTKYYITKCINSSLVIRDNSISCEAVKE